ncbi:hypothetical protein CKO15_03090 [Halorhodospira abdelmalekii]|uniref:TrmJ/YjtD family RNA methyltransferase n=1 Tax=Halorhodospira abdelmalekii TaxID=421629 RepID=UPI0019072961|nr:hypothetical protein [Halorhodospira abdelmalekii]
MEFEHVRIVLVGTTHPGNIGATARAMHTMGLQQLCLVDPQCDPRDDAAVARAARAEAILEQATQHATLAAALSGCQRVYGLSARPRAERYLVNDLRTAALGSAALRAQAEATGRAEWAEQAWIFGRERTGLSNAELDHCHELVHIPTNPYYSSLNVASAVQLVAWELRMAHHAPHALTGGTGPYPSHSTPATVDTLERFFDHLEQTATTVGYLERQNPELTMRRLRNIFRRAALGEDEVRMLRGLLSHILDSRRWKKR